MRAKVHASITSGSKPAATVLFPLIDVRVQWGTRHQDNAAAHARNLEFLLRTLSNLSDVLVCARWRATGDAKPDAQVHSVRKLAHSSIVSDDDFAAIKAEGYSDAIFVEIRLAFATTVFTIVCDRINPTEIDLPAVA